MNICKHNIKNKVLIVAEIGNNHEGNLKLAKKLIKEAYKAGADAVKFQTFITEEYISQKDEERFNRIKSFQLSFQEFKILKNYADSIGMIFFSSIFDLSSAKLIKNILPLYKISSGDINFYPLLEHLSKTSKPIILSTGISNLRQVKKSYNFIKRINANKKIIVLHCISEYPTIDENANLSEIQILKKNFPIVGYSDHTLGIEACISSVALGARIIEKHFTIDKNYSKFRDHQISSDPLEFLQLVKSIRRIEKMMLVKNKHKVLNKSITRSIVLNTDLKKDTVIKKEHISWLRPGYGIPPGSENLIVGKKVKKNLTKNTFIKFKDIY